MHTLAPPTLPVNHARAIAGGLCLVCTTLAPLPSHAFTYDVLAGSVIVQHQSTGTPLVWPTPPVAIRLELGDAGRRLLNGTTSWDENAASALATWNATVPLFVQQATALNVVRWATPEAGEDLGSQTALTRKEYGTRHGHFGAVQATVLLNPAFCWDAYDGPLRCRPRAVGGDAPWAGATARTCFWAGCPSWRWEQPCAVRPGGRPDSIQGTRPHREAPRSLTPCLLPFVHVR